jgi:superfamily I DNA/RNA helicase
MSTGRATLQKKHKYLIVDEAQDFSQSDIEEFVNHSDILILYGDSAQRIYKTRGDNPNNLTISIERIAGLTGYSSEQLVFNHRLPKKVARVAEHISSYGDPLEMRCKDEGSEKPYILAYDSLTQQLDAIAEIIKNREFEDVGILFGSNKEVEDASNYLETIGLKNEAKYGSYMDLNFTSTNPKLLTYHSAKGLQFEAVFIPECRTYSDSYRSALYVAMTRTYQSLYIMHSGNLSPFFNDVPKDAYESSLSAKATEVL